MVSMLAAHQKIDLNFNFMQLFTFPGGLEFDYRNFLANLNPSQMREVAERSKVFIFAEEVEKWGFHLFRHSCSNSSLTLHFASISSYLHFQTADTARYCLREPRG
jgi:hypothetical protein